MTFPYPAGGVFSHAIRRVATTGLAGYTLVNGTGPIVAWTAPNDGNLHAVLIQTILHVSGNETGGDVNLTFNAPDGSGKVTDFIGPGKGIDAYAADFPQWKTVITGPGGTVTLAQASALTLGAAVLWAELWAS